MASAISNLCCNILSHTPLAERARTLRGSHARRMCKSSFILTRRCTRVSKAVRSVLEGPQWLIWTVLTYMLHIECV